MADALQLFGHIVESILHQLTNSERNLDVLELFAGVGSIYKAAKTRGMRAEAFDKDGKYLQPNQVQYKTGVPHDDFCTL